MIEGERGEGGGAREGGKEEAERGVREGKGGNKECVKQREGELRWRGQMF